LFRTNNYPKAYVVLSQVISKKNDDRAKALAFRLLARIHFNSGDSNKATEYLAQSTDLFTKAKLRKSVAINHKILGRYYANKKEFVKATERFEMAKTGLETANDSIELFYVHINLIAMKIFQGKYAEAKELAKKNSVYITDKTDRQALALLYNNQGEIEFLLQNYDSCRMYYHKTLELPLGYITDILRRGNACIGISKAYMAEKKQLQSLQFAHQALQLSKMSDLPELQYNANRNLAELYQTIGQFEKANFFLNQATPYLEELGKKSVENSETVYQSTINRIKLENDANKIKAEKQVYVFLFVFGTIFSILIFIYSISTYRLLRSRNQVLKALVKKNLQLIDDERKLNEALHIQLSTKKLTRKSTDEDKDLLLYNELTDWLTQGKQFLRKDLTAEIVARELGTNRDYLSRAVSSQQLHFNELINKYRIEEAVKILSNKCDKRNKYNLNIIASDVGFKSMSVFIEAFRKQTGMNPAQFRSTACSDEKVENS
jgi:AraC-like DNA-binding protein